MICVNALKLSWLTTRSLVGSGQYAVARRPSLRWRECVPNHGISDFSVVTPTITGSSSSSSLRARAKRPGVSWWRATPRSLQCSARDHAVSSHQDHLVTVLMGTTAHAVARLSHGSHAAQQQQQRGTGCSNSNVGPDAGIGEGNGVRVTGDGVRA
eukprot:543061-Prymnesium_polylepis.1